ncbi:MAG: hypothetical protein ACOC6G_00200 [Thermoproteota archaeon]
MRLFKVRGTGNFSEFKEQAFKIEHTEENLEAWLEQNSESIVEDGALLIIGRQVTTNLGGCIDLLALDRDGDTAIVELKRGKTPRETVAQALEYASWVENLGYSELEQVLRDYQNDDKLSLAEYHKAYFTLREGEGVSFNKDQRIVIVGYQISQPIRETALFLRNKGLRTTCLEFNYFKTDSEEQLMSVEIVVGKEPVKKGRIKTESRPITTPDQLLNDLDDNALPVFNAILELAKNNNLLLNWGSVGFSLNTIVGDTHVPFIMGYPKSSAYSQTIYTYYPTIEKKVEQGKELFEAFKNELLQTGLFEKAGDEVKYIIKQTPSKQQIENLTDIILKFSEKIKENGLIQ